MKHELNLTLFRQQFEEFADEAKTPETRIALSWRSAVNTIGNEDNIILSGDVLDDALNLLTAHFLALNSMRLTQGSSSGGGGKIVTGTTVDKVSMQFASPVFTNSWQYYLNKTPYGEQLLALLKAKTSGGLFLNGRPETKPFRKVGGRF